MTSGLKKFEKDFNPEVVADTKGWENHPELSKLLRKLQSIKDPQQFRDHYAEAMVARHLIRQGCKLQVEVPTANGKNADFKVYKGSETFFIHVKRLNFDEEMQHDLNVGTRLDSLRKKGIWFSFNKSLTDEEMQYFYKEANKFSKKAKAGERKVITSRTGEMLGECDKVKNGQPTTTVYSVKDVDESHRFSKKLKEAYKQFIPDGLNIILATSAWRDNYSIKDLRESVDDFWSEGNHSCSNIIGWFTFEPRGSSTDFKLFFRENYKRPSYILDLFSLNAQKADISETGL